MPSPDITQDIPLNVGNPGTSGLWINSAEDYDIAVGGLPFFLAPTDQTPYQRETAPYRKDQFDTSSEPGEQSLTGWWIRSQSSFHGGDGINFYDPSSGETTKYRFADSKGVDVWTRGEVSLLKNTSSTHITTGSLRDNGRTLQTMRSIEWSGKKGILLQDEYDVDKIDSDGNETHFINYNAGVDAAVYAICDDGVTAYWITNTATKKTIYSKALTLDYTTPGASMFDEIGPISNAIMDYVKDRIVLCADNKVYEFSGATTLFPTAVYTHPASSHIYTSITASGPAIYIAGYNGIQSSIHKFTLITESGTTAGQMPKLSQAIVAAEMPVGEIIHAIKYYLGRMLIGTSKGIRAAEVSPDDGSLIYGPLIVETSQPCYDFAFNDHYAWCATGVNGEPGVIRIDLGNEIEPLRFAWANDVYFGGVTGRQTTTCAFLDGTNRLAFTSQALTKGTRVTNKAKTSGIVTLTTLTDHGLVAGNTVWIQGVTAVGGSVFNSTTDVFTIIATPTTTTFTYALAGIDVVSTVVTSTEAKVESTGRIYLESATELLPSGSIITGAIRYGTLEPKNYKFIRARGNFTHGAMDLFAIDADNNPYTIITYNAAVGTPEAATTTPEGPQEYLSYKFTLSRSATNTSLGPVFKGYQAKALPATERQRVIQFPVWCFDVETDRFNVKTGYEGRAWERIQSLESVEKLGDIINVQDFTTGERVQAIIEKTNFIRKTPPSGQFDGFGGLLLITVKTVL